MSKRIETDVAIVGGGPGGSATGSLLRKYSPDHRVAIFEREKFPREHVGESLLPSACRVLSEMDCWDAVEKANFPIKIGATYRWGQDTQFWDFEFLPVSEYQDEPRPGKFQGIRARTAFQVDRAEFDRILLDSARERGCDVYEESRVVRVARSGNRIDALYLEDGTEIVARHYVDASGNAAVLRRAMGVGVTVPTLLQNVAFWDYWENTEWAVSIGKGATRILVLSIPWGWIWFIPVGPTRTSIGLVCPAAYYKEAGLSPADLYQKAIAEEPKILELTRTASREGDVRGTKDWSFLADSLAGDNWYLVGETAGFADPILSAGVTLTLSGARELAYSIIAADRLEHESAWLFGSYEKNQKARMNQHIRFADFWYSANGQFSDLKDFTRQIAYDAGLKLTANEAFQWLGTGGFTNDITQLPTVADISVSGVKVLAQRFTGTQADWALNGVSVVTLDLEEARESRQPTYQNGKIASIRTFERKGKVLPLFGFYGLVFDALRKNTVLENVAQELVERTKGGPRDPLPFLFQVLEVWLNDGWIKGVPDPRFPAYKRDAESESPVIHSNRDVVPATGDLA